MKYRKRMKMRAGRTLVYRGWTVLFLAVLLFPVVARAEPSTSMSHLPILWLVVIVGATTLAMVPLLIRKLVKPRQAGWVYWVLAIVLAFLFLVLVGPIIVALGSILITGRTM